MTASSNQGGPEIEAPHAASLEQPSTVSAWFRDRAVGLIALGLLGAAYGALLLVILFAPEDDPDTLVNEELRHWTDDASAWYWRLSAITAFIALLALVMDKKRDIAGVALAAAFMSFLWPWGT